VKDSLPWDRASLTFFTRDDSVLAQIDLRSGLCRISWRGRSAPTTYLTGRAERLAERIAGWMPEDSLVGDVRPCPREEAPAVDEDLGDREPPGFVPLVRPEFPDHALGLTAKVEVRVKARVDPGGRLAELVIVESHPLFDEAVVSAMEQWTYVPATQAGRPVESWLALPFRFDPQPAWPAPYERR